MKWEEQHAHCRGSRSHWKSTGFFFPNRLFLLTSDQTWFNLLCTVGLANFKETFAGAPDAQISTSLRAIMSLVTTNKDNQGNYILDPCPPETELPKSALRVHILKFMNHVMIQLLCGYVITSLALMLGQEACGAYYLATDINPDAVRVTRETLEVHGIHAEVITTDIASGLER
ncbi:hypothetical protein F0562_029621 [Nyssa sinensis]|uniref:Uncharacterized protein n=1 Tax=Nyssa sinensis TaxID=561372 RepID=A0A5J5B1M5_9ASTE|nr:hypothetical protein F0562_029621 [Nyssa sinensis]